MAGVLCAHSTGHTLINHAGVACLPRYCSGIKSRRVNGLMAPTFYGKWSLGLFYFAALFGWNAGALNRFCYVSCKVLRDMLGAGFSAPA
jgi:hypothetical protein